MDRIRVLIAEDESAVREAMADLVSSDPSMDVVGTAADAEEAIQLARAEKPDVALIDVKMPAGGGTRAARLIQILSHELFTPITTIQGFALTVSEHGQALRPEEIRDLVEGVSRASARIKRLIGNLAAAARLDREGVEVSTRPVVVGHLLGQAAEEFPQHQDRLRLPEEETLGLRLWADQDLGVRPVVIVLENALALSPDDEPIEIDAGTVGTELEIAISDRGPGVPEGKRESIFEAFTQTDSSTTRAHEGLGIGLYLARRILRAHGGRIEVAARPGGGSRFVLAFPAFAEVQPSGW